MTNKYKHYSKKVFLDSNIILEALPLLALPWKDVDALGPILILLTPTLLKEIDSKKKMGVWVPEHENLIA
jgi:hypothetical protein